MKCDPATLKEGVRCLGDSLDTPSHHRHVRYVVERDIAAVEITADAPFPLPTVNDGVPDFANDHCK